LSPKICPSCKEQNRPDSQFCFKCNFIMSFEAYQKGVEEKERKDQELKELKEQMSHMRHEFESYDKQVNQLLAKVDEVVTSQKRREEQRQAMFKILTEKNPGWDEPYLETLRKPFTPETKRRLGEFKKQLEALPPEDLEEACFD